MTSFCLPQNVLALKAQGADEINIKCHSHKEKKKNILPSCTYLSQVWVGGQHKACHKSLKDECSLLLRVSTMDIVDVFKIVFTLNQDTCRICISPFLSDLLHRNFSLVFLANFKRFEVHHRTVTIILKLFSSPISHISVFDFFLIVCSVASQNCLQKLSAYCSKLFYGQAVSYLWPKEFKS